MKLQCTLSYLSAFKIKILKDNKDEKFQKPEKCTLEHQKFLRIKLLSRKSTSLLFLVFWRSEKNIVHHHRENKSIWSSFWRSAFSDDILCLVFLPEKKIWIAKVLFNAMKTYNTLSRCLKITEKVAFWKLKACGQTVLPYKSFFCMTKIGGKWKNYKIQMRHFE